MDKDQFKNEMTGLMQRFYQEEQGNRITTNNIDGLMIKLSSLVDAHKPTEKKK